LVIGSVSCLAYIRSSFKRSCLVNEWMITERED